MAATTATITIPSTVSSISVTVGIIVHGYYTHDNSADNSVVTVSLPTNTGFITGGGYIIASNSAGRYAATVGTKTNFGFNVKYNKQSNSLQGNLNIIIRHDNRIVQIKSTSFSSLTVSGLGTRVSPGIASFTAQATIFDITDPLHPTTITNVTVQVNMVDNGEPGSNDTIGITVNGRAGVLYFSSNWNGSQTVEQKLAGGNLQVHSNQLLLGAPLAGTAAVQPLNVGSIEAILPQAIAIWQAAGFDVSAMKDVGIQVADLWSGSLAWSEHNMITFDRTAQGYGWSTDPSRAPVAGQIDLLTVLVHEVGHQLGFDVNQDAGDVMDENLAPGVRRLGVADEVAMANGSAAVAVQQGSLPGAFAEPSATSFVIGPPAEPFEDASLILDARSGQEQSGSAAVSVWGRTAKELVITSVVSQSRKQQNSDGIATGRDWLPQDFGTADFEFLDQEHLLMLSAGSTPQASDDAFSQSVEVPAVRLTGLLLNRLAAQQSVFEAVGRAEQIAGRPQHAVGVQNQLPQLERGARPDSASQTAEVPDSADAIHHQGATSAWNWKSAVLGAFGLVGFLNGAFAATKPTQRRRPKQRSVSD
jgi:hypothetical protein